MSNQSPFVVPQLQPERINGRAGVYQLTADSVSPVRIIGVDDAGLPIEDTVPACYWREFVTMSGCTNKVQLRTSPQFSNDPDAMMYEQHITRDLVAAGWIPLHECPYTNRYKHLRGGPFVKVPPGEEDCGGKPGGCEHMHNVIKLRKERSLAAWRANEAKMATMKAEQVHEMMDALGKSFGAAVTTSAQNEIRSARRRGSEGKTDTE